MIKLHNSLTKQVSDFTPIKEVVRIYTCGPTVYDNVHIGNLSSFIFADVLNRAMEIAGHKVQHVMNITDVDDKTINRSRDDYPEDSPEIALKNLTKAYELAFMSDLSAVGNRTDKLEFINATDSIELMQDLISELLGMGFAYIADDGIYFSIEAYQKDGKKYGQLLELDTDNTSKARINNDEYDKQSTHDFALWKLMKPNEPAWSFQIDDKDYIGRPGWHIECSAMSTSRLSEPFDIHTGGIDLIFPHHENEIAQSTAGKEDPTYAKFFVHNEHLLVDKRKMSKSLGNIYTLKNLKEHGFDPLTYRMLILQSHYRNQANFSWDLLTAAKARLIDINNFVIIRYQTRDDISKQIDFESVKKELNEAILDDLNTPKALAILSNFQNQLQNDLVSSEQLDEFNKFIEHLDLILGLELHKLNDINEDQKNLLSKRSEAREQKNWKESDEIRDKLIESGIGVRDTDYGQIWYFV